MPPMNDQMRKLAKAFRENSPEKHELTKGLTAKQVYRAMSPFAPLEHKQEEMPLLGLEVGLRG